MIEELLSFSEEVAEALAERRAVVALETTLIAHGFRAPPYNDVNIGFTNLAFGYTAIPNPNLKSETSRGVEAGLRA